MPGKGGGKGGDYASGTGSCTEVGGNGGSGGGGSGPNSGTPCSCGTGAGGSATQPGLTAVTGVTFYGTAGGTGVHVPGHGVVGGGGGGATAAGGALTPTPSPITGSPIACKVAGAGGGGLDLSSCFSSCSSFFSSI